MTKQKLEQIELDIDESRNLTLGDGTPIKGEIIMGKPAVIIGKIEEVERSLKSTYDPNDPNEANAFLSGGRTKVGVTPEYGYNDKCRINPEWVDMFAIAVQYYKIPTKYLQGNQ